MKFNITLNDFESLKQALKDNRVSDEDIDALQTALEEDAPPTPESGAFGPKVSDWVAQMMRKASEGTWGIGVAAGGGLLAQIISKFYGL